MLRRAPIFIAADPQRVSSGLQPDLHPLLSLLWEAASNVTFAAGRVKRRVPPSLIFSAPGRKVRGISQQQATNGVRWLWAAFDDSLLYRWYGPAPEDLNLAASLQLDENSLKPAGFVDFTHFGDWTLVNSSTGPALLHKPNISFSTFGDAPQNVAIFRKRQNFILAFGYGERGTRVGWSDADNIESWTASQTNLAGSLTIDDMDTRIKTAVSLGGSMAVYAEDQMALVNYVGAPFYFGQRMALDGIGAIGKFSVASDGKSNYGVGRGGVWWTDGLSYRYIDEGYLHDYLQDNVNWSQGSKITACRNDYTGCYEFSFPLLGSLECNEAWSFDPRTGGWSPIPAFSIKDERRLFNKPVMGLSTGLVQRDQDHPGLSAPLTLRTRPLLMQVNSESGLTDSHLTAIVDEVELLMKASANVQFRLLSSQQSDGPWATGPWVNVLPNSTTYKRGPDWPADGVYWKLEFQSTAATWVMDLQGFMLYGSIEGTKRD
jgi:hypothetical protein